MTLHHPSAAPTSPTQNPYHRRLQRRTGSHDCDVRFFRSGIRLYREKPTTKDACPRFLVLIGVARAADGFDVHIPRGYIYFAVAFAPAWM